MDNLYQIFGSQPSYIAGLLGEDEAERLRKQAQQSAMMNFGLSLLAASGPSTTQRSTGQLLAQGIMAGQQANRSAYEQAVRDRMIQQQIQDQAETARQQRAAQQMAQGLFVSPAAQLAQGLQRTGAEVTAAMPEASAMDVRMMRRPVPEAQTTGIDMDTLRNILINAPRAAAPYMQTVEQLQKLTPKPEDFVLGEGQIKYRMVDGKPVAIAGAPKEEKPAGAVLEAMQVLGIMKPIASLSLEERKQINDYINRKAEATAPKVKVDLKDPTAVATAQLGTVKSWNDQLKENGDAITASRAAAFYNAYNQAKQGNTSADGALIYNLAKVYDPSGAVQQGDVNTIIGNRSIPTQVQLLAQRFKKGGTFTPEERNNMKTIIDGIVEQRQSALKPIREQYQKINKQLGGEDAAIFDPYANVKPKSLDEILGR